MDAETRAHYEEITDTQWDAVYRLVHDGSLAPGEKKRAMLAAFAEHDIPINGYLRDGMDWSFVELARRLYCEPLMEIVVEQAPNKATEGVNILAECIWSEKCIKILLDRGHTIDPDDHAQSLELLRQCAEYAEPGAITLLAGAGMPMNRMIAPYGEALPAIVHAARHGKTRILGALLRAGADPAYCAAGGETFIHASVKAGEMQATDRADAPRKVEELGHVLNVARELGVDIDCRNELEQTPLHLAAKLGYMNKAALLLDYGADAAARDHRKKTPLMLARAAGRKEMVALLLSWNARQAAMRAIRSVALPGAAAGHTRPSNA